ncbi:MAG: nucleoside triphosphate pyrophosphohydrolase [Bdellovibrionota bacterium]
MNPNPDLKQTIFTGLDPKTIAQIDAMADQFKLAVGLVARLRGPNGCPWDREQNHLTLRPYLIEEAYEVLDLLDRYQSTRDPKALAKQTPIGQPVPADGSFSSQDRKVLCEELGDLLLQVLLHSQLASERGEFNVGDVGEGMARKLVSRHPHVFGTETASSSEQVLQNWESLKKKEGKKSLLEGLPKNLPSLQRAARIGEKAGRVGFDWKDWQGAWAKVEEELRELKQAIAMTSSERQAEIEQELGDLFFALCNLARHLKIQPEDAHRKAIEKFEKRFRRVEEICSQENVDMQSSSLEKLDEIWERVKRER